MTDRTYRTTPDGHTGDNVTRLHTHAVNDLMSRIRKLTTTDEGKVAITIEVEIANNDMLEQIRSLIYVQQGPVLLSISGAQGKLPL